MGCRVAICAWKMITTQSRDDKSSVRFNSATYWIARRRRRRRRLVAIATHYSQWVAAVCTIIETRRQQCRALCDVRAPHIIYIWWLVRRATPYYNFAVEISASSIQQQQQLPRALTAGEKITNAHATRCACAWPSWYNTLHSQQRTIAAQLNGKGDTKNPPEHQAVLAQWCERALFLRACVDGATTIREIMMCRCRAECIETNCRRAVSSTRYTRRLCAVYLFVSFHTKESQRCREGKERKLVHAHMLCSIHCVLPRYFVRWVRVIENNNIQKQFASVQPSTINCRANKPALITHDTRHAEEPHVQLSETAYK